MPTLVFTYSPKAGVSPAEFEKFLFEIDQPATLALPAVISSRILRVTAADAPFAYVEVLDITSHEDWQRDAQLPAVKEVVAQWPAYGDTANLKAYACETAYTGVKPA